MHAIFMYERIVRISDCRSARPASSDREIGGEIKGKRMADTGDTDGDGWKTGEFSRGPRGPATMAASITADISHKLGSY